MKPAHASCGEIAKLPSLLRKANLSRHSSSRLQGDFRSAGLSHGTPVTTTLLQQTRSIPIVFVNVADPVGSGLVSSFNTGFGAATLLPGFLNFGSLRTNQYSFGGGAWYNAGDMYFRGFLGGMFGDSHITNTALSSTGSFGSDGITAAASIGKIFTLADTSHYASSLLPSKSPPKAISGYSLKLDVDAIGGYVSRHDDGYTDTSGFVYGTQLLSTGFIGAQVNLFATWVDGPYTLQPFATAAVVHEVGYSNNLQIPIQVAVPAGDTVHFGSAQTMFGTRLGIDVLDNTNGIKFGVSGSYDQSAEYQTFGGRAFIVCADHPIAYRPFRDRKTLTLSSVRA